MEYCKNKVCKGIYEEGSFVKLKKL